ncbi:Stf0 family sulfotransferase [Rhizobium sp. LjRoot254]|uniref:Stf0 family sulfotransferase n=1 Tax=Rhizobium sp. LjRoot254 TaxID=3342297 RepID=UPI003ECFD0C9
MATASYIICATPRSGSTLLCDLLTGTGRAGKPASYYRQQSIPYWAEHLAVPLPHKPGKLEFERAYLSAVIREGNGESEIFGLRLMWEGGRELAADLAILYPELESDQCRFAKAFGQVSFLHLSREDKVAQAVSRLKAEQSGLWHMAADGSERERTAAHRAPVYDAERIAAFVDEAETHDAAWRHWFVEQGIEPLHLTYEGLTADPGRALAAVLHHLGLDAEAADVKTRKMADQQSLEWAARFRAEASSTVR